jgi:hypothetical protein
MRLERILDQLNSFEKNNFIKILDSLLALNKSKSKEIENILNGKTSALKDADNIEVAQVFNLVQDSFKSYILKEFNNTESQLDILIDILIRDGNSIMKNIWFSKLYENEVKHIQKEVKTLKTNLESEKPDFDSQRLRDYTIYLNCLKSAYNNDYLNNRDKRITQDEQTILNKLSESLGLSQEEVKKINYIVVPILKQDIETIINDLKNLGVLFYSKKTNTIFIADEVAAVLRSVRNKDITDKHFRRILRCLREPQINMICRKHNLDWRGEFNQKIRAIINGGINIYQLLSDDVFKEGTSLAEKKKWLNDFWSLSLKAPGPLKGSTIEEKIKSIIGYFDELNKDEHIGISLDGYENMIQDLEGNLKTFKNNLLDEFQIEEGISFSAKTFIDFGIKPRDVLDIISQENLQEFCQKLGIKSKGDLTENILSFYTDAANLLLESYVEISTRDLNALKERGIKVKEADLGIAFEDLTKQLFTDLGFNVDESLRKSLNTTKDKIDILINLGDNNLILVECKTTRDSGFNKFSAVSRQMISYKKVATSNGYSIIKSLLIAPEFSDDFISDTNSEMELNLSLITSKTLKEICDFFKSNPKHSVFPFVLFMKDVVIQHDRIIKALSK